MPHADPTLPAAPTERLDAAFPALHVRPATGWINDPNGPFRWDDTYHLFLQHNPDSHEHESICWGHATSRDLVDWYEQPIALRPTSGTADAGGCWSGCVVDDEGTPTAVYTGVLGDPGSASICLAYAEDDDLRSWRKHPTAVAVPPPGMDLLGFRDPFVFFHGGSRYAIVGAGAATGGAPSILLYSCDDLTDWRYLGILLDGTDPVAAAHAGADIWECPQLAMVDGRWVLIVSLWVGDFLGRVAYLCGDLSEDDGVLRFTPVAGGLVDSGHDFYAPAVLIEPDRVLLWGWSWEDRSAEDVADAGWAGALTLPRELRLVGATTLVSSPASELASLRTTLAVDTTVDTTTPSICLPSGPIEVDLLVDTVADEPALLSVDVGGAAFRLTLQPRTREAVLDRAVVADPRAGWPTRGRYAAAGDVVRVRILLDASLTEVYVEGGPVFTERLYPEPGLDRSLRFEGGQGAVRVSVWELGGDTP